MASSGEPALARGPRRDPRIRWCGDVRAVLDGDPFEEHPEDELADAGDTPAPPTAAA